LSKRLAACARNVPRRCLNPPVVVSGISFALCDGSVHAIGYEIDVMVFQQLGDRRDGQTFDKSEF
jgi:hypothetical protein